MESINKKLEKNININNKKINFNINKNNRYIDNNFCINNISENITKKKTKQIIHKFEDYFIFWN
jgi:hypothetical protein